MCTYTLDFPILAIPGAFYTFPCDADGSTDDEALNYHVWQTLQDCRAGRHLGYEIGASSITTHFNYHDTQYFFRTKNST